jgi:hypothetical protein
MGFAESKERKLVIEICLQHKKKILFLVIESERNYQSW